MYRYLVHLFDKVGSSTTYSSNLESTANFTELLIQLFKGQNSIFGELEFGEVMMLKIVHEWRQKNNQSTSNINLATYHTRTNEQKAAWEETYMNNKIVTRLMIMNCAYCNIATKIAEAIKLRANAQYPTLIPKASTL